MKPKSTKKKSQSSCFHLFSLLAAFSHFLCHVFIVVTAISRTSNFLALPTNHPLHQVIFFFPFGCKNCSHLHAEQEPILHANGRLINMVARSDHQPCMSWPDPFNPNSNGWVGFSPNKKK